MPKTGTTNIERQFKDHLTRFHAGRFSSQTKALEFLILAGFTADKADSFQYSGDRVVRINVSLSRIDEKLTAFKQKTGIAATSHALYEALLRGAAIHFPEIGGEN